MPQAAVQTSWGAGGSGLPPWRSESPWSGCEPDGEDPFHVLGGARGSLSVRSACPAAGTDSVIVEGHHGVVVNVVTFLAVVSLAIALVLLMVHKARYVGTASAPWFARGALIFSLLAITLGFYGLFS